MRRLVKWGLGIAVIVLLAVRAFPIALLFLLMPDLMGCIHLHRDLAISRLGDKVASEEALCGSSAASNFVMISLTEAHGGNHGTIFSYNPYVGAAYLGDPPPHARWIDDTTVVIHVDRVDTIDAHHPALGRDKVRYDIGAVSSR